MSLRGQKGDFFCEEQIKILMKKNITKHRRKCRRYHDDETKKIINKMNRTFLRGKLSDHFEVIIVTNSS
jgi:hypothetical protein